LTRSERILLAVFVASLPLVNPYVRGDGNGYYAYVRSAVIDHDLQFENEYRRGDPDFLGVVFRYSDGHLRDHMRMPTGFVRNQWSVGSSLLWAPFFLEAHAAVLVLGELGLQVPPDGYTLPYRAACAFGTALYAFLGLLLAHRTARLFVSESAALWATLAVWSASSLPVYMYFLPFHVHALAAFVVSAFLWYGTKTRPLAGESRATSQWIRWGLLGGLMVLVYSVNALILLFAVLEWLREWRGQRRVADALGRGVRFAAAGLLVLSPHFAIKWLLHGSPLRTGLLTSVFWDAPRLREVAFSAEHGFFLWTPVLVLAAAGLVLLFRRDRPLAGALIATLLAFYYFIASYEVWHGASAFGSRFFVSFTPMFILGLGVTIDVVQERLRGLSAPARTAAVVVPLALLTLWNVGLVFQWGTGLIPREGPVDFRAVARNQITAVPARLAGVALRYFRDRDGVVREHADEASLP
jgi:hypothetical protein